MDDFITVTQAAERAGVTRMAISKQISAGTFPGARKIDPTLGRSTYLIPLDEFEAWLSQREARQQKQKRGQAR